ncbi:MAG: aspartyl protease family protein [Acidobacteriota bacterium]|nr:aspartyl protease family protein [Acidobacteriota bacterium]
MRLVFRGLMAAAIVSALTLVVQTRGVVPSQAADVEIQIGQKLFSEGKYPAALAIFREARAHAPEPGQQQRALEGMVRSALRVAEFDLAMRSATELVAAQPQSADAAALYGDALWSDGLFPEAEQQYRRAVQLNPKTPRALNGLAVVLSSESRLQDALQAAQDSLTLDPAQEAAHHTVGMIYERMHRYEDAADAYAQYVERLPNKDQSLKAAWVRAEIKFLRSFEGRTPFAIEGGDARTVYAVPFQLVGNKIVVQARLNGGPEHDLVVDTGAEQTVVSEYTARALKMKAVTYTLSAGVGDIGLRGLELARLDSLQVGSLVMRNVACVVKNPALKDMPTGESDSFSPLALGLSMRLDYDRDILYMARQLPEERADVQLPLYLNRLATVRGTVDGRHPASFVVDTGGEVISISQSMAGSLDHQPFQRIPLKVYGTSGWDRDAFLMPGVDLAFAGIRFTNFPVVVLNLRAPSVLLGYQLGGIVGQKFLSRYRVTIDLQKSVLGLSKL